MLCESKLLVVLRKPILFTKFPPKLRSLKTRQPLSASVRENSVCFESSSAFHHLRIEISVLHCAFWRNFFRSLGNFQPKPFRLNSIWRERKLPSIRLKVVYFISFYLQTRLTLITSQNYCLARQPLQLNFVVMRPGALNQF